MDIFLSLGFENGLGLVYIPELTIILCDDVRLQIDMGSRLLACLHLMSWSSLFASFVVCPTYEYERVFWCQPA